jgi:preprotein translocase subunit SecG
MKKTESIIIAIFITLIVLLNIFEHTLFYRVTMLVVGGLFFLFCLIFAILNKYDKLF